jgi:hypothetical protein
MTRWPLILLTLALAGSAVSVVSRRAAEPDRLDPCPWDQVVEEQVPEAVILRILAKQHLVREVAARRQPILEAAALFRELNRLPPALHPADHPSLAGRSEEELLCRQVIAYVAEPDCNWPEAAAQATVARLEAELQEELRRHGAIRLPDPAGLPPGLELLEQARARMTEAERRACLPARRGDSPRPW